MKKNEHTTVSFEKALALLKKGEVVALPTETVYGLGAVISNTRAVQKIFSLKKRPPSNPLIVHCYNRKQAEIYHKTRHPLLDSLMGHFCPGPLTLVLEKTDWVPDMVTAGSHKVAVRFPAHPVMRKMLKQLGKDTLVAPSANRSGKLSPTQADHVVRFFDGEVPVLDGGPCTVGLESTVVEPDFSAKVLKIWRLGAVRVHDLKAWLKDQGLSALWKIEKSGSDPSLPAGGGSRSGKTPSPGQMRTHYQPSQPLVVFEVPEKGLENVCLSKLARLYPLRIYKQLVLPDSGEECAKQIYKDLFILSQNKKNVIYVMKVLNKKVEDDLWDAIWDRLIRASSHFEKWDAN